MKYPQNHERLLVLLYSLFKSLTFANGIFIQYDKRRSAHRAILFIPILPTQKTKGIYLTFKKIQSPEKQGFVFVNSSIVKA